MRLIRSTRDQLTALLRDDLLCGRVPAGTRLSEVELARRFGVGRGPVREAFVHLASEGLLLAKPNCGVTVAPEPAKEIRNLIVPIRQSIETFSLKLYFESIDERDFRNWEEILHRMQTACRAMDKEEVVLQDMAFHRSIIERANQPDLAAIWQNILVRVRGHFHRKLTHYNRRSFSGVYQRHRDLLDVFRKGNKKSAVAALARHIA